MFSTNKLTMQALKVLPWILLLIALICWAFGLQFPGKGQQAETTEVIESTIILEKVESLGRMELVKYSYKEIFDYKAISSGKISGEAILRSYDFSPDLKAVLIASGEAVGCIDLGKLEANDIEIKNDTLTILLPEPELCYHKLDMENTKVYDFERSGWWSRFFGDDDEIKRVIERAYQAAERQIRTSALEGGILQKTNENAKLILKPMLEKMSGKTVILHPSLTIEQTDK